MDQLQYILVSFFFLIAHKAKKKKKKKKTNNNNNNNKVKERMQEFPRIKGSQYGRFLF
jgi:hypothetical protein